MSNARDCLICGISFISSDGRKITCSETCRAKRAEQIRLKWNKENSEKIRTQTREYGRKWREQNPEKVRSAQLKARKINPEKRRLAQREWKKKNPEKVRSYRNKWAQTERGKIVTRLWQYANPEKMRAYALKQRRLAKEKSPRRAEDERVKLIAATILQVLGPFNTRFLLETLTEKDERKVFASLRVLFADPVVTMRVIDELDGGRAS